MSFCKRLLASFLAASLALGVFCPVQAYAADRETPAQWAAWIGEALANGFTDLVHSFQPAANISGIAAWSLTYGTSAAMAQAVRDLPEYKELYGSNPLDHSTVIHAYDGGEMVSVLDASGLYNAYLWLHGGIPPQPEDSGGSEPFPDTSRVVVEWADSAPTSQNYTFSDGFTINIDASSINSYLPSWTEHGLPWFIVVVSAVDATSSNARAQSFRGSPVSSTSWVQPAGVYALGIRDPVLAEGAGYAAASSEPLDVYALSTDRTDFVFGSSGSWNNVNTAVTDAFVPAIAPSTSFFYSRLHHYASRPTNYALHVLTTTPVYIYGQEYGVQGPPAPIPEPVPPVGPSSPDIQNPEAPDVPESDGPIQYNTTTNITVTLPDGTTTVVEAPTVDTLPIVQWLSIINSNLVAWSRTIYEAMDGWLANISQWLQEIYSEVEAFKLSMDAWMVSLLSAIDKLGGDWPMSTEDNTNYWNNVTVVNNNIWSGAPDLNAVNVVADDFERLKGKFPVSIPWDLASILLLFKADPVTPVFSVPLVYFDGSTKTQTLDVDLEPFDGVMSTWRRLVFIAFAGALALKSKDLLENFAEVFNIV